MNARPRLDQIATEQTLAERPMSADPRYRERDHSINPTPPISTLTLGDEVQQERRRRARKRGTRKSHGR